MFHVEHFTAGPDFMFHVEHLRGPTYMNTPTVFIAFAIFAGAFSTAIIAIIERRANRRVREAFESAKRFVGPAGTEVLPFKWLVFDIAVGKFIAIQAGRFDALTDYVENAQRMTYQEAKRHAGKSWGGPGFDHIANVDDMARLIVPAPESLKEFEAFIESESRKMTVRDWWKKSRRPGSNPPPPADL